MRLFEFFRKPRTNRTGQKLTDYEIKVMRQGVKKGTLYCPDCKGKLLAGPEGGCSVNCLCENCGSEFNMTVFFGTVTGERISDAGPRDPSERRNLYKPILKV